MSLGVSDWEADLSLRADFRSLYEILLALSILTIESINLLSVISLCYLNFLVLNSDL